MNDEYHNGDCEGCSRNVMRPGPNPCLRERRKPSTEEQDRRQARYRNHAGIFRHEKHRKLETRVLGVKSADQLLLRFDQIEWGAIGLCHGRGEKQKEPYHLRERRSYQIPARKKSQIES